MRMWPTNAARALAAAPTLTAEVLEHGEHPPVIGTGGREVELHEDVGDVLLHRARADLQQLDDPAVGALEHVDLSGHRGDDRDPPRRPSTLASRSTTSRHKSRSLITTG
jgi:hypothetical protein